MAGLSLSRSRQAPAEDSPAFGGIAERFRRGGDLDRAIVLCREGLQKFPNQLSARVTLGWALLDKGDYAAARAELEQVLRRAPDNLAAIRGLAELHERADLSMPSMDEDSQWTSLDLPAIEELPPVQVVAHVSSEDDLAVPVDAQGNPLMVSAAPIVEAEVPLPETLPDVELLPPAAVAMAAAVAVEPELPGVGAFEPIEIPDASAETPALLSADESTDDLAALAALTFEVDAAPAAAVAPALFSVTAEPDPASEMALDPFIEAEPLVSADPQEWPAFEPAALTDVAAGVGEAGVTDLVLDLPAQSTDLELTQAFAALEAASPGDGLDDEPIIDLIAAQSDEPVDDLAAAEADPSVPGEAADDWATIPIAQLDFVTPVPADEVLFAAGLEDASLDAETMAAIAAEVEAEAEAATAESVVFAGDAHASGATTAPAATPDTRTIDAPVFLSIAPEVFAIPPAEADEPTADVALDVVVTTRSVEAIDVEATESAPMPAAVSDGLAEAPDLPAALTEPLAAEVVAAAPVPETLAAPPIVESDADLIVADAVEVDSTVVESAVIDSVLDDPLVIDRIADAVAVDSTVVESAVIDSVLDDPPVADPIVADAVSEESDVAEVVAADAVSEEPDVADVVVADSVSDEPDVAELVVADPSRDEPSSEATRDDAPADVPSEIEDALPIAAFSDVVASAVADLIMPAPMPGLSLAAFAAIGASSVVAGQPTMNGHAVSRRSALPALERLLRQVEARRLQLASGSPA